MLMQLNQRQRDRTHAGQPIRVGAVEYLNTKPLIENLLQLAPNIDLRLELPSKLADQLRVGDLDVALIPVVEYFRGDHYRIIPDVSIASHGPVLSVTLFSRVPWAEIRSVAMDVGSRTSAALTQVLLAKRFGIRPQITQLPMDVAADDMSTDAVLLIGDRAMQSCLPGFTYAYDLGQEWYEWTKLPFVFAVWAVRADVDLRGIETAFAKARDDGLRQAGFIAQREGPRLHLDPGLCRRYLSNILCFDLSSQELAGLLLFQQYTQELGLSPTGATIEFYHSTDSVESGQR
ncbi:MAG: menaquinone biosynthesis protein [Zavarzinella sp.]